MLIKKNSNFKCPKGAFDVNIICNSYNACFRIFNYLYVLMVITFSTIITIVFINLIFLNKLFTSSDAIILFDNYNYLPKI